MRNSLMSSIGFLSLGQFGNNITMKFEKKGYSKIFYLNSATKDLDRIDTTKENIFHFSNALGCSHVREQGKKLLIDNYDMVLDAISQRFSNCRIIFTSFAMGGGTSGASLLLIYGLKKRFPNIVFDIITSIPDSKSSATLKKNAVETFEEIVKYKDILGNIYFINNSNLINGNKVITNYDDVDNPLVDRIDNIIKSCDEDGDIDSSEIITLLSSQGNVLSGIMTETGIVLDNYCHEILNGNQYLLYSIGKDKELNREEAELLLGIPEDDFIAHSNNNEFVVSFGMDLPYCLFENMKQECEQIMKDRQANTFNQQQQFSSGDLSSLFKPKPSQQLVATAKKSSSSILDDLKDFQYTSNLHENRLY